MSWETLSNAFLKFTKATATTFPESSAFLQVSVKCINKSSVQCPARQDMPTACPRLDHSLDSVLDKDIINL